MRAGHLWLAAFAVFPIVGGPLLAHPGFHRFGLAGRAVLAGGVGAVLLSWTMTVWALAGIRWGPLVVVAAALAAFGLRLALRGEALDDGHSPAPRGAARWTERIGAGITALSVLTSFVATAAARSTSADLLFFWGPKAQAFGAARTIDAGFLATPDLEYLHVDYPPLVTNVLAFGAMLAGRLPWGAVTMTFPLLLGAMAVGLASVLRPETPGRQATTALAVSALALLGIHASVAGNAEPFLWFFEVVGLAILLSPAARSAAGKLLAGLLFAGAAASKVEGLPFVLAAVVFFSILDRDARRPIGRTLVLLLVPTAVSLGTWFAYGAATELFYGYQSYGRLLAVHWEYLGAVLSGFARAFWKAGYALPFLVPLLVLLARRGKTRRAFVPIGVAVALAGFFAFTYLHGEGDPRIWLGWSAARVFSPLTALFALAAHSSDGSGGPPAPR